MIMQHQMIPGADEALIGIGRKGGVSFLVYDHDKIMDALKAKGIAPTEAEHIAISMADENGMSATAPITVMRCTFEQYEVFLRMFKEDK